VLQDLRIDVDDVGPVAAGELVPARVRVRGGAVDVVVARLASGRLVVVNDACPHDGRPISSGGFVDGERIVCGRHGWELAACRGSLTRCNRPRTSPSSPSLP
jgi:phenylpropionate dioxygenase-like ring-hydroxylating dioxygenase large terminal subunit